MHKFDERQCGCLGNAFEQEEFNNFSTERLLSDLGETFLEEWSTVQADIALYVWGDPDIE